MTETSPRKVLITGGTGLIGTRLAEMLIDSGYEVALKVEHARLGIAVQEVNQTLADSFKLDKPEGALIANVEKGSPGEQAGLQIGDVIRKVDGQPIISSGDLPSQISLLTPGSKVQLDIWRKGNAQQVSVKLGNASDKTAKTASKEADANQGKLGLALRPLQPGERREGDFEGGLIVEDTAGPAATAGVQAGDVLLAINGTPVLSVEQVRDIVAKSGKSVALLVQRGNDKIFVPVKIG